MANYKGFFKPKNPQKYNGNPTNIIYRSGWELKFMMYFVAEVVLIKFMVLFNEPCNAKIFLYYQIQ